MVKKAAKKIAKKAAKKAVAAKGAKKSTKKLAKKSVEKLAVKAPAMRAGRTVNVGLYGMAKIVKMIHDAGLEAEFNDALSGKSKANDKIVKVDRKSFETLRNFVGSKPVLSDHPVAMELSECDPNDPFDICFGKHATFKLT